MDYQTEYTKSALKAVTPYLYLLPSDVQRKIKLAQSVVASHGGATVDELRREFGGSNWVLARRTKAIIDRYGKDVICLSRKQYDAAERRAIERRVP